jgi:hypothetical protein
MNSLFYCKHTDGSSTVLSSITCCHTDARFCYPNLKTNILCNETSRATPSQFSKFNWHGGSWQCYLNMLADMTHSSLIHKVTTSAIPQGSSMVHYVIKFVPGLGIAPIWISAATLEEWMVQPTQLPIGSIINYKNLNIDGISNSP